MESPQESTEAKSLARRLAERTVGARLPLFVVGLVLVALAYVPASNMRFDRSIERMFAANDPLIPPYERLKRDFGGNEVVLAVYRDENLLNPDGSGIKRLASVSQKMKGVPGVRDVLSLSEVNGLLEKLKATQALQNLFAPKSDKAYDGPPILHPTSELSKRYRALFEGYTHSYDGKTVALACMLEPTGLAVQSHDPREATIEALREHVENLPDGLSPGVLAGEPVMVVEGFKLLEADGKKLGFWSTLLLGLTMLVYFREIRWLVVPVAIVQWTILVTQGLLVASGLKLTMVSSMLTAIITVVGVATVIHLIVRFRELRRLGQSPQSALTDSLYVLAGPIIGACLTDAAGFGSLWCASVGPVKDFGTMMVVGSLLVLAAVLFLVPWLTMFGSEKKVSPDPTWGEAWVRARLSQLLETITARPWATAIISVVISAVAIWGSFRLDIETDFTRNFRENSRLVNWYDFVETQLGGAGVWDVIVPAPRRLDDKYLARVRVLEEKLRAIRIPANDGKEPRPGVTKVISLVDALDAAEGDVALGAMPVELRAQGMTQVMPVFMGALRSLPKDAEAPSSLRIMLRAKEQQSAKEKQYLIDEVKSLVKEAFPGEEFGSRAEVTGFFVLLTNLIESMLRDQWTTFGVATAGIFLLLILAFRRLAWALIALVPNALPIFLVMGLLGWLGLKINMGSAMIAAVSMGLSVDSSIHYLSLFNRLRKQGLSVDAALAEAQQSVGLAMFLSTAALCVGFLVLLTSEFVPTIYFGALVSLAMLGGLAGNIIILPLLLRWVEKR